MDSMRDAGYSGGSIGVQTILSGLQLPNSIHGSKIKSLLDAACGLTEDKLPS